MASRTTVLTVEIDVKWSSDHSNQEIQRTISRKRFRTPFSSEVESWFGGGARKERATLGFRNKIPQNPTPVPNSSSGIFQRNRMNRKENTHAQDRLLIHDLHYTLSWQRKEKMIRYKAASSETSKNAMFKESKKLEKMKPAGGDYLFQNEVEGVNWSGCLHLFFGLLALKEENEELRRRISRRTRVTNQKLAIPTSLEFEPPSSF